MSGHYDTHQVGDLQPPGDSDSPSLQPASAARAQFDRRSSTRYAGDSPDINAADGGIANLRQLSRRNSVNFTPQSEPYRRGRVVTFRDNFDDDDSDDDKKDGAVRTLSAREAVAAQEAAEAAAAAKEEEDVEKGEGETAGQPMTMSLMDLLEETDRELGLEGSRYILSDEEDDYDEEEEEDEGEGDEDGEGAMEHTCCVCMVRHKGSAFITCGHSFCRMCSRELNVSKGNCPICHNYILELLEVF